MAGTAPCALPPNVSREAPVRPLFVRGRYFFMHFGQAGLHGRPQKLSNCWMKRNSCVNFSRRILQKRSDAVPVRSAAQPALGLL